VEFTEAGRKRVIKAYQERKQEMLTHPLLEQNLRLAQMPFIQARILARHLRATSRLSAAGAQVDLKFEISNLRLGGT